jgi:hypothetical protein
LHGGIELVDANMKFNLQQVDLEDDLGITKISQRAKLKQVVSCSFSIVSGTKSACAA